MIPIIRNLGFVGPRSVPTVQRRQKEGTREGASRSTILPASVQGLSQYLDYRSQSHPVTLSAVVRESRVGTGGGGLGEWPRWLGVLGERRCDYIGNERRSVRSGRKLGIPARSGDRLRPVRLHGRTQRTISLLGLFLRAEQGSRRRSTRWGDSPLDQGQGG